ncbi:MAG TPA: triose-phosphate isomerase [Mycobacteriales bacterium]|jgi:triosephosphate isomerase|nr:triose-phosphate isomerase [Mycobacteriales bacterium]
MAANWKMNLTHLEAIALVQKLAFSLNDKDFDATEVAVLPPFTDIRSIQTMVDGDRLRIKYGAQDLSPHDSGAFTGDISGVMLAKLGCSYVTVGHSERRKLHGEGDEVVNSKVLAAYRNSLTPILCVGEPLDVRQAGGQVEHATAQLSAALKGVTAAQARSIVLAYEPIWAIGTGEVATPEDAQQVCAALRSTLASAYDSKLAGGVRVLYGGSVKPDNIAAIMEKADVDGALVGGASLVPEDFVAIVRFYAMTST